MHLDPRALRPSMGAGGGSLNGTTLSLSIEKSASASGTFWKNSAMLPTYVSSLRDGVNITTLVHTLLANAMSCVTMSDVTFLHASPVRKSATHCTFLTSKWLVG